MGKQKKKRNKAYRGADARQSQSIIRVTAEERGAIKEWWLAHGRTTKISAIIGGGALFAIWVISELLRLISGTFGS